MERRIPVAFTDACRALERGELALALMHCDHLRSPHPAEAAVLDALVRRRAENTAQPWLESLLASWEDCGRPRQFTFLAGVSLDEELEALAESADPARFVAGRLEESAGIAVRLWMLNSPRVLLEGAIAQLSSPADTLGRLFTAGQLAAVQRDESLRDRAAALRSSIHREIAEANPTTFELAVLPVIDAIKRTERLDEDHIPRLIEALTMDSGRDLANLLYVDLVNKRRASTGLERRLAWADAITILPDPGFTIWRYAKSQEQRSVGLVRLLEQLGAREAASVSLMRRIIGFELLRLAAPADPPEAQEALEARLAAARRLTPAENRFNVDWPIDPLSVEVTDALARDEVELLSRCAFGE